MSHLWGYYLWLSVPSATDKHASTGGRRRRRRGGGGGGQTGRWSGGRTQVLISCFKRLSFIIIFKKESKKKRRSQKQREREVEASSSSHLDTPAEKERSRPILLHNWIGRYIYFEISHLHSPRLVISSVAPWSGGRVLCPMIFKQSGLVMQSLDGAGSEKQQDILWFGSLWWADRADDGRAPWWRAPNNRQRAAAARLDANGVISYRSPSAALIITRRPFFPTAT